MESRMKRLKMTTNHGHRWLEVMNDGAARSHEKCNVKGCRETRRVPDDRQSWYQDSSNGEKEMPTVKAKKKEQERVDWNHASNIFKRHFPHVPVLTDDHPCMPPEVAAHRRSVIAAIMDGMKAGRYGDGSTMSWSDRS